MYRILLVDDEALIREAVSENVKWEEYGYELAGSCENGREALEFIEKILWTWFLRIFVCHIWMEWS